MEAPDIFLFGLAIFIFGIILGLFLTFSQLILLGFFVFSISSLITRNKTIFFLSAFFFLGALRSYEFVTALNNSLLLKLNDSGKEAVLLGKIIKEPEIREYNQRLILKIIEIEGKKTKGKILVYTKKGKKYLKEEILKIKGYLRTPPVFEDFNFKEYLKKQGILSVVYYPEIKINGRANFFWRSLSRIKEKSRKIIDQALPSPENYLLRAMILGDKKDMPESLKEDFNKAGIRHITAISGMHIMILINILMAFLIGIGFWRKQAGILALIFIFLYIVFIGFQPSAVRASILSLGLIFAQILGRLPDAIRFLLFAASIILALNPFLIYDIGFQLSFLAAAGINYLTPFLNRKLKRIPKGFGIRNILSMTFSAQIFVLPLLLYHFGYLPLISPLSNLLILPFVPFILALGFFGVILGLIFFPLSLFIFFPLSLPLAYIIFLSNLFAKISFFGIDTKISLALVIIYYFFLFLILRKIIQRERYWFLEY
jgi:competence protein ComEC